MPSFPDAASLISVTIDSINGAETNATAVAIKVFYEDSSELSYGSDGSPFVRKALYFIPGSVSVKVGDKIKATRVHGRAVTEDYAKIRKCNACGGMRRLSHIEVET